MSESDIYELFYSDVYQQRSKLTEISSGIMFDEKTTRFEK